MTTLQELNNYIETELPNNPELASLIHDQSCFSVGELIDDEPSLNKNNAAEYSVLFCLGAVWAISQNIRQNERNATWQ